MIFKLSEYYFEIRISPNSFFDLFLYKLTEFTQDAIEIDGDSLIIRTQKDKNFVDSLFLYLDDFCANLGKINNESINYTKEISTKKNLDWIKIYQDSISPLSCGKFYIRPPWARELFESKLAQDSNNLDSKQIEIILEPSLAFGSGHHATTFMCIEALQNYPLENKDLLDLGCGSGILALCAFKLGARVFLCDIDELAIDEAKKNFSQNNATITRIWLGSCDGARYDVIVANIVASVIIANSKNLVSSLKDGGILILSGILDKYRSDVLREFGALDLLEEKCSDEWICLVLRK